MDHYWDGSDQTMLLRVLNHTADWNINKTSRCYAFALPAHHLSFASKRLLVSGSDALVNDKKTNQKKKKKQPTFPTFMHLTSYRLRRIADDELHDQFLRYVLNVHTNDGNTVLAGEHQNVTTTTHENGFTWEDMISSKARRSSRLVRDKEKEQ